MIFNRTGLHVTALAATLMLTPLTDTLAAEPVGPELTPKLRGLLIKEMRQIDQAMQDVFSAIIKGEHERVAEKGQAIHDSFIVKQSLTQEDRQDLKAAVPSAFLQMDAHLHELAASLAEAGRSEDTPLQLDTFTKMTEACIACHSTYTTDRFPGLKAPAVPADWVDAIDSAGDTSHHDH
ncbi:hypothetical protein [Marinimicrobium sp. LS-A18]|uniref:hypothetical protein n=1 Tax=Marinimicrobium sp. LS-A18 TaxID=1381596 RepID=UPI0004630520|nr:hypothetical protein [Marinimicrobium sp. LS-A18]